MLTAATLAIALAADPRPALIAPQFEGRLDEALVATDRALAEDGDEAGALGLDYLRGHLFDRLGRRAEACEAFARAMVASPRLALHGRYRMALDQERAGHPEVAAGLVASVVGGAAPPGLVEEASRLFVRTLAAGGDCRLLGGIDRSRLPPRSRRRIDLAAAACARASGTPDGERQATAIYTRLLREDIEDEAGRDAAEGLAGLASPQPTPETAALLGKAFHWHRHFDRAAPFLETAARRQHDPLTGEGFETIYALVRGRFWQEDFAGAAVGFGDLAGRAQERHRLSQALFQQARSQELADQWPAAAATYRRTYRVDPSGRLADAALLGALRLEWRQGDEASALELYELLRAQRGWVPVAARAALFLASTDLVRGRRDRAGFWLDQAERGGSSPAFEATYWRGRLAELDGAPEAAVSLYLRLARLDPYHPLALDVRQRLARPELTPVAVALGRRLASSATNADLLGAWVLLGGGDPAGRLALERLRGRWAADPAVGPVMKAAAVPVERWPLWKSASREPEDLLLGLGIWTEGAPAVGRHFPQANPDLALTGSLYLARAGDVRRSLARAEAVRRQVERVPSPVLPLQLRRLLYPFAYSELIVEQSLRRGVDPFLLAAIVREESRFDPRALSGAAARGLTQFVVPTARRLGVEIGLGAVAPEDLYRPEIAVALGAAYLAELAKRFDGQAEPVVAAYNAGEPMAELWRRHCASGESAEYFTKVGFVETRAYLEKVLRSWAVYRDLYRER